MKYENTTIIIPTLDEELNIGRLIEILESDYPGIKIIVSDDGSSDKTIEIAKDTGASAIDRSSKKIKGITASVLDALRTADTRFIVVMDADMQHPPQKVKDIVDQLGSNDIVIAVRENVTGPWGAIRKLESKIATSLANLRLSRKVRDPLSGFFGIRTELFKRISKSNFELRCFKILFNILKNARGIKIGYVNYDFNIRTRGQSKIGKKHIFYFIRSLLR